MKLLLFDIDNTLLQDNKAHMSIFNQMFKKVYNINADIEKINHHGLTDKYLIHLILKNYNIDNGIINQKIDDAIKFMIINYKSYLIKYPVSIIPGVEKFLAKMGNKHKLGIVSGNLKEIAKIKLQSVDLWKYFYGGGFGDDAFERYKLVKIAISRAEKIFNTKFLKREIILFGDTIHDITAAKKVNILAVGIEKGIYSKKSLIEAGADFVFQDFRDLKDISNSLKI